MPGFFTSLIHKGLLFNLVNNLTWDNPKAAVMARTVLNLQGLASADLVCRHQGNLYVMVTKERFSEEEESSFCAGLSALDLMMREGLFLFVFKQAFHS